MVLLFPSFLLPQNTIRVEFQDNPSRNSAINALRLQGTPYGSINDMAEIFSLETFENNDVRKLDLKLPPMRMKITAGTSFIVITDQSERERVYQSTGIIVFADGIYYAPLPSFIPIFNEVFNQTLVFDESANTLRVSSAVTAPGIDIPSLTLEPKANGLLIRVSCSRPLTEYENWLRNDGWLYVTIADAKADIAAINRVKPTGLVKEIVAIQSPSSVQLTFKLNGKIAASEVVRQAGSNDLLISLRTPGVEDKVLLEKKRREIQTGLDQQRKRWELDVIVLDAGHGGVDFGAIGVSGVREKDVTLGITLKLGKLIEKQLSGVKIVYTRKDDRFIPLYRRGQMANEASGKLFISIHANSLRRKPSPTRGFEVYLLRPGRTDEAINIAERENSVIELEEGYEDRYQKLTDENFILVTMAQSAYMRASELFADVAQQEMEDHLSIPNRGVRQAGFLVLVGASMPNVLVETAYLSNREDERFLKSEAGQKKIAEALFSAVKRYKVAYEQLLKEGSGLGER
ncbi:MAG: N-acetylmuramoyl-L-alanine amidase [Bacteroidota bacterium]